MRHVLTLLTVLVLSTTVTVGCDKKKEGGDKAAPAPDKTAEKAGVEKAGVEKGAEASFKCDEKNAITISGTESVDKSLKLTAPFELKKTVGWLSGMQGAGKTTKHAYVGMANYDGFKLRKSFGFHAPSKPGEVLIQLDFSSEAKPAEIAVQKKVYAGLSVGPGEYKPGRDATKAFSVTVFNGAPNGHGVTSMATGKAVVTQATATHICGTLEAKNEKGLNVKGSFAVEIEKDMWAQ